MPLCEEEEEEEDDEDEETKRLPAAMEGGPRIIRLLVSATTAIGGAKASADRATTASETTMATAADVARARVLVILTFR